MQVGSLTRQLVWVHGAFIVLTTIIGFGTITLLAADDLLSGVTLAAAVNGFIGLFLLRGQAVADYVFSPHRLSAGC